MGNVMGTLLSGFGEILGKLLGHPLDFLSGKACSMCPNMGFSMLHRELLYSSTDEIGHGVNPLILRSLIPVLALQVGHLPVHLSHTLQQLLLTPRRNRRRHQKDIELAVNISSNSSEAEGSIRFDEIKRRRKSMREHRKEHMRKSLRPKSHRMQVEIITDSMHHNKKKLKNGSSNHFSPIDDHIRVSRRPKFAQKGTFKGSTHPRRRT
ncbi:hypothetical protein RND71_028170 [Anisodus tanguticus]|uniref:Uncharacterized protein n=1 Tax=Anisodus tanguticus TaxID=243964 RepID=A0AAE1RL16_9SOLA|nr:hypothetical protein RND71_028170 [Anisodus tanguticus]